jgi:putative transcriptional regulator
MPLYGKMTYVIGEKGVLRMAITSRLSVLMGERRYNIQAVMDRTGLDRNTVSNLYHDKLKRIDLKTLDKLCNLFDCEPGEVLIHTKAPNKSE